MSDFWTKKIIADYGRSLGQFRGQKVPGPHYSTTLRYMPIFDYLIHHQDIKTALTDRPVIADYAVGEAMALMGLLAAIKQFGILERAAVNIYDNSYDGPITESRIKDFLETKNLSVASLNVENRDILNPPDPNLHFTLGIIGFVHYYLNSSEFTQALVNRVPECDYLAVLPATPTKQGQGGNIDGWMIDNTQGHPQSNYFSSTIPPSALG